MEPAWIVDAKRVADAKRQASEALRGNTSEAGGEDNQQEEVVVTLVGGAAGAVIAASQSPSAVEAAAAASAAGACTWVVADTGCTSAGPAMPLVPCPRAGCKGTFHHLCSVQCFDKFPLRVDGPRLCFDCALTDYPALGTHSSTASNAICRLRKQNTCLLPCTFTTRP